MLASLLSSLVLLSVGSPFYIPASTCNIQLDINTDTRVAKGHVKCNSPHGYSVFIVDKMNGLSVIERLEDSDHPVDKDVTYKISKLALQRGSLVIKEIP